jgi:hypothetical protein
VKARLKSASVAIVGRVSAPFMARPVERTTKAEAMRTAVKNLVKILADRLMMGSRICC